MWFCNRIDYINYVRMQIICREQKILEDRAELESYKRSIVVYKVYQTVKENTSNGY
jgi:hypothetical protein